MQGVPLFAKSLDTRGFYTHAAADVLASWDAFGEDTGRPEQSSIGAVAPLPNLTDAPMTPSRREFLSLGGAAMTATAMSGPATTNSVQSAKPPSDGANWGRWSADDQKGAVNLNTPAKRLEARSLRSDGQRFIVRVPIDDATPPAITVVLNWTSLLNR